MVKKIKNKYLLCLAFFIIFLFGGANFIFALEVPLPGLPTNPTLTQYIIYIFNFAISMAGILALISFTIGAVTLIASTDNAEAASNAKDRMKSAVLGLVLTVSSFIIINTINPALTKPSLTSLTPVGGVFYTNGSQQTACPENNPDTSTIKQANYNTIQYCCNQGCSGGNGPTLLITMFPKTNYAGNGPSGYDGVYVQRLDCGGKTSIAGASFMREFETPGVYFYLMGGSSGYVSTPFTSSQDNIQAPFAGNIKSVRIVNDPQNGIYYGVIFHQTAGLEKGGICSPPIAWVQNTFNQDITISAYAVDIFTINQNPISSGNGVSFYSEPLTGDRGTRAGVYKVPNNSPQFSPPYTFDPSTMKFDYTGIDQGPEYTSKFVYFKDHPGSIDINGNYLVGLYSGTTGALYCQTFNKVSVENLNAQPFIAQGNTLNNIYIIPTK